MKRREVEKKKELKEVEEEEGEEKGIDRRESIWMTEVYNGNKENRGGVREEIRRRKDY